MNKYKITNASKNDMDFILNLNQNNMPAVSHLTNDLFFKFLDISDYFKVIKYREDSVGFLIALLPDKFYNSINYKWFNTHYKSFIYVDRIVISEENQNKGLGGFFYNNIKSEYKSKVSQIACEVNIKPFNEQSIIFHKKSGFKEVGQQRTENNKKIVSLQIFKL
jgi:predicted GNAT superfamily acetyltransferase